MSMTKGTPASSQIIWLEQEVERLTKERDDKDDYIEELAKKLHTAEMARDAAIKERDSLMHSVINARTEANDYKAALERMGCIGPDGKPFTVSILKEQRDAAIKERDEALSRMSDKDFERTAAEIARDAAIARAEAAEERFKKAVLAGIEVGQERDDANEALTIAYLDGAAAGRDERDALRALLREAMEALNVFLGGDERVQVAIGGNPYHVDELLNEYRDTLARIATATGDDNG